MEEIALELKRLNKTMAEILHLIQKEMKKSEDYAKELKSLPLFYLVFLTLVLFLPYYTFHCLYPILSHN